MDALICANALFGSLLHAGGQLRRLVVITVLPGEQVHELTNGDCFLRVGDESRRRNFAQRQELEFDRGQRQFDGHPSNRPLSDVNGDRLDEYCSAVGATSVDRLLKAQGLVDRDNCPPAGIVRLRALRSEGPVVWEGKSPNDPRAAWSLPE